MRRDIFVIALAVLSLVAAGMALAQPSASSAPRFMLAGTPSSESVWPLGPSAEYQVTATPINGFAGLVEFGCQASSSHINCSVSPGTVMVGGVNPVAKVSVHADTDGGARPGTYTLVVIGTSRGLTNNTVLQLVVR